MVECVVCEKLLDETTVKIFSTPYEDEYFVCGSDACYKEATDRYV